MPLTGEEKREYMREYNAEYRSSRRQYYRDAQRKYIENNPERARELKRLREQRIRLRLGMQPHKHQAHVKAWESHRRKSERVVSPYAGLSASEAYRLRYRSDPDFRVKECLRRQLRKKAGIQRIEDAVRRGMHAPGESKYIEHMFGYSIAELRAHLERQFRRGMTWSNYCKGGWHIDHILPKKCFDLSTHDGIKAYWSLSNLRPLSAHENHAKAAKVVVLL